MKNEIALTTPEQSELDACEHVIRVGKDTFISVGLALATIRDKRLYRIEFKSFAKYCETKWGLDGREGHRKIIHAKVAKQINDATETSNPDKQASKSVGNCRHVRVSNEGQARELAKIPEDRRMETLKKVKALLNGKGKVTAKAIAEITKPRTKNNFVAAERPANFDCYSSAPVKERTPEPFEPDEAKDSKWQEAVLALVVLRQDAWADELSEQPEKIAGEIIAAVRKAL